MRNQRGNAAIMVVSLVALAAIAAAAYFAYQNHRAQAPAPAATASATPSATPSASPEISRTNSEDLAIFRVSSFFNGYAAGFPNQSTSATQLASFLAANLSPALIKAGHNAYYCGQQNSPLEWRFDDIRNRASTVDIAVHSVGYSPEMTIQATYDKATHLVSAISCP